MAFTARLFMLLAIAVPILAQRYKIPLLARTDALPEEFPSENEFNNLFGFGGPTINSCPPFGHTNNSFNVTVVGTTAPKIGGCASMRQSELHFGESFNLWLGSPKTGGGKCGDKNMDHYIIDCLARQPYISKERTLEGWQVILMANLSGQQSFRRAVYETVSEDPPMLKMVIGVEYFSVLSKRMEQFEQAVPEGSRHTADGSMALIFSRDSPLSPMWSPSKRMEQSQEAVPKGFRYITDGSISLIFEDHLYGQPVPGWFSYLFQY